MSPPTSTCKSRTPYRRWRNRHWPSLTVSSAFSVLQTTLTSPHLPSTPHKTSQRRATPAFFPGLSSLPERPPSVSHSLSSEPSQMTWVWDSLLQGQEASTWHFPNFTVCPESPAGPASQGAELLRGRKGEEIIIFSFMFIIQDSLFYDP